MIADFAKKLNGKFEIKGGFMDGKVVDMATVNALAAIPALPVLQAQVLGTMLLPFRAWLASSSRSPRRMARLPKRLPPRRQLRLPPPSKRPHTIDLKLQIGGKYNV